MAANTWTIAGRQFRTKADYEAARRDQEKIDQLRQKYGLDNREAVYKLQKELADRKIQFRTVIGNDFLDEVNDAAATFEKKRDTEHNKKPGGKEPAKTAKGKALSDYDEKMRREILYQLSLRERRRKMIVTACSILAVACLGYFGVYYYFAGRTESTYNKWSELKGSSGSYQDPSKIHLTAEGDAPEILEEYELLYNKNKSLIGWVKIDDTVINYPVMQTSNNEYYLDHNLNQEYDKNGSIFMDKDCDVLEPSTNFIIYGHHMKSGKMFGDLDKYSKKSYFEDHPLIEFDTIYEKGTYAIMYVFRSRIYNENEITFKYYQFINANSPEEFNSYMESMAEMSLYDTGVTAAYGDQLLTLSTCDSSEPDGRFVVVAKKVK